jgi:hypothetical protein
MPTAPRVPFRCHLLGSAGYDDRAWPAGKGPFGFGDGAMVTTLRNTFPKEDGTPDNQVRWRARQFNRVHIRGSMRT